MQNKDKNDKDLEIGLNIIENITTGMYRDSLVVFRECIQNSCDQISQAEKQGILKPGEGKVEIWIDEKKHSVSIEDNATGIRSSEFQRAMYSIGVSTKPIGEVAGFRGIGHWCGLGYCETLKFTSKAKGEKFESVMICDAERIRKMIDEYNTHTAYYSVNEALSETTKIYQVKVDNKDSHYFKVEMIGIRNVHADLFNRQKVKDYLSFVAPVGYSPAFRFRSEIRKYSKIIGQPVQEYNISVDGETILKKYTPSFTTSKGEDSISSIDFKVFKDDEGNLIAWLWFGISCFKAQMLKENQMRGIRLRSQNIQIGGDDALQKLFKEDRGQYYFIGEVFAIAKNLIPNAQRDYFNENEARLHFERQLSNFFNNDLSDIYKEGSKINSRYGKIEKAIQLAEELYAAEDSGKYIPEEQRKKYEAAIKEAENAEQELEKIKEKNEASLEVNKTATVEIVVSEIIKKNEEKRSSRPLRKVLSRVKFVSDKNEQKTKGGLTVSKKDKTQEKFVAISKVRDIVYKLADSSTAKAIMAKIEKEIL